MRDKPYTIEIILVKVGSAAVGMEPKGIVEELHGGWLFREQGASHRLKY